MFKGDRIILRAKERDDLPRLHEFSNDIEVRLLGGGEPPRPQSRDRTQNAFEESNKQDKPNPYSLGDFVIEADGKCIGVCSLGQYNPTSHTCHLGISIGDKDYWGRGYGRETIALLLDYGFRIRNLRRICLSTSSNNERALRCYRACGFVEEGRLRQHIWNAGQYVDEVWMGILRDEYEARSK